MPTQPRLHKAGTLVIARLSSGLAMRSSCADHVWRLKRAHRTDYGSGWAQAATCLVCGDTVAPMDVSWFRDVAEEEDIDRCIKLIKAERRRLYGAVRTLRQSVE